MGRATVRCADRSGRPGKAAFAWRSRCRGRGTSTRGGWITGRSFSSTFCRPRLPPRASATIGSALDGVNLLPFLTGTATGTPHEALYWRFGGMMAIRRGDWKLVKTREGPFVDVDPSALRDLSEAGLYNLSEDIGETRNRAAERPDKVKELSDLWQQWNRQLAKPLWSARARTPARSNAGRCLFQVNSRHDCGTQADADVAEIDQRRRRLSS